MLGLSWGFPAAFCRFCHRRLNASPASMIASEDPTVPTPTAVSPALTGALNSRAMMFTHRFWSSVVTGYSSMSA
uniref:Uncharacterized protein n=1 Tax=Arundo donax TaxID=35708 RepID=A0A0A9DDC3_ARUDO